MINNSQQTPKPYYRQQLLEEVVEQVRAPGFCACNHLNMSKEMQATPDTKDENICLNAVKDSPISLWDFNYKSNRRENTIDGWMLSSKSSDSLIKALNDNYLLPLDSFFTEAGERQYTHVNSTPIKTPMPVCRSRKVKLRSLWKLNGLLLKLFLGDQLVMEDFRLKSLELHILAETMIRKNRNLSLNRRVN